MATKPLETLDVQTASQWRKWLARHHQSKSGIWLVFHKRHTGRPSIAYDDAADEALCFGWIDSLIRRLDDDRYAFKFTPRRANSIWSSINRKRYERLRSSGRLMPAGLKIAPTDRTYYEPPRSPAEVPEYIREAIKRHPAAWKHFESLAPSYRRLYLLWIDSAKKPETKERRLKDAIKKLAAGQKPGLK